MQDLTSTDRWYFDHWAALRKHYRRPPTVRELAAYVQRDVATVHERLCRLVDECGVLAQDPETGRFIRARREGADE